MQLLRSCSRACSAVGLSAYALLDMPPTHCLPWYGKGFGVYCHGCRYVNGINYGKLESWLVKQDNSCTAVMYIFGWAYGNAALVWYNRWRMFYLACSEVFRYSKGEEWGLGLHVFEKPA